MNVALLSRITRAASLVSAFALLAGCAHSAHEVVSQKPYTLQVRFGSNTELARSWDTDAPPSEHYLDTARKLDIDIAAVDAGRVEVRGASLDYRARVDPVQGNTNIAIHLTRTGATYQRTLDTRLSLPLGRWVLISASRDVTDHGGEEIRRGEATYIRILPDPSP